ncbi:DUF1700 domain-containing protein [Paenibacillus albicereus]|uniref:DUF1700 domain-containing protein n=1 Tax=Paenibacillus albicereus TaxID=2726185 RepID=A0A6H2GT11_9BACL|nr:DUF1700 domain-containing protein [Paenibacillus albicereus]QJC50537.1 DUF1700 domain-containing protein [Paenibacillus albicereus]
MTRDQYLNELWHQLSSVPEAKRREWMYDYEEHFRFAAEQGQPEAATAAELGDPRAIAKELLLGYRVQEASQGGGGVRLVSRAVFAAVGLGFFNLVFVLGPYLALLGMLLALWAVAGSFVLAAFPILYEGLFGDALPLTLGVYGAMVAAGLGLLLGAAAYKLTGGIMRMTLKYLLANTRMMKRSVAK